MNEVSLKAREPYLMAAKIGDRLSSLDSPGDFEDWQIYWIAGVTTLRSIWHVLEHQAKVDGGILFSIVSDFRDLEWGGNSKIYREFVSSDRNDLLKEWHWKVEPVLMRLPTLYGDDKSFMDLIWEKNKHGEDALELFEKALLKWHQDLCIIEQAIKEEEAQPFSDLGAGQGLLDKSNYSKTRPLVHRL